MLVFVSFAEGLAVCVGGWGGVFPCVSSSLHLVGTCRRAPRCMYVGLLGARLGAPLHEICEYLPSVFSLGAVLGMPWGQCHSPVLREHTV